MIGTFPTSLFVAWAVLALWTNVSYWVHNQTIGEDYAFNVCFIVEVSFFAIAKTIIERWHNKLSHLLSVEVRWLQKVLELIRVLPHLLEILPIIFKLTCRTPIKVLFRMVKWVIFRNLVDKLNSYRRTNNLKRVKKLYVFLGLVRNSTLVLTRIT